MIEVRQGPLGLSVYAARPIEGGCVVLQGWGQDAPHRTRHTIQVDHGRHLIFDSTIQLLNHSCEPNCGFLIRRGVPRLEVHTLRPIEPGEEMTVDYASFEDEILFLGPCLCGSESCRGSITGYGDLPGPRREAYGPYVAEYLRQADCLAEVAV